ncbi:MAG: gliding motility-associated C-terminal domain-containing protein, partial [Prevotellaceae bacterium]|nr:gliding motility-associated C-terminal domain-containing protein [Prevotellaceae bacterium]
GAVHTAGATAGAGETVVWYTAAAGGAATVAPGRSAAGTTTAYAAAKNTTSDCESTGRTAVSVVIDNVPNAPAANSVAVCYDGAVHTAGASAGAGEMTVWYTAAAGGAATVAPSRSAAGTTTAYAAARNSVSNCESAGRTAVSVRVYNLPNVPVANNVAVCYDGAVHTAGATAGAGETTVWYTAAVGGAATVAPSRSAAGTTTAYAAARNTATGCESAGRATVSITINALPALPAAMNADACYDGAVHTAGAGVAAGETIVWYTAAVGGAVTAAPSRIEPGTTTAYAAARNTVTGCESAGRTAVSVNVYSLPNAPVLSLSGDNYLCPDESVILTAETTGDTPFYAWFRNGAPASEVHALTWEVYQPGTYTIVAISDMGCPSEASVPQIITSVPLPERPIIAGDSLLRRHPGTSVEFTLLYVANDQHFQWYKDNEMIAGAAGATFTVSSVRLSDAGMYFVRAHTLYGDCVNDSRPVILEILHDDITVSTIVTPNNDNTNEFLHIDGLDGVVYEIKIVNRYGNEVFHTAQYSNDSQDGWKGDNLPDGVYFYRIDWIDQDGIKRHKVGYITLKR